MQHTLIDSELWLKIKPTLPKSKGRQGNDDRLFLEAVCWIMRTQSPWRQLPNSYGNWKSVYNRYSRWSKQTAYLPLFETLKTYGLLPATSSE